MFEGAGDAPAKRHPAQVADVTYLRQPAPLVVHPIRRRASLGVGSRRRCARGPVGRYPGRVFKRNSAANNSKPAGGSGSALKVEPPGSVTAASATTKGKATPKRRDAEALRRTSVIATGGRAGARGKESRAQYAARRQAMMRGDDSALPARDRGPVRRFVRDYVDSRRTVVSLFLPVGFPIMVLSVLPGIQAIAELALWAFFIAIIIDSVLMARKIRREVGTRFPSESTRGLGLYAVTRAMQIRRLRMPKPRVARGAKI